MKRCLKLVLVVVLCLCSVVALVGCNGGNNGPKPFTEPIAKEEVKIGLICLHDEQSTYDKNFIDAMYRALEELGLNENQLELVTGIGEDQSCYDKACELAATCDIVFADSFGHEPYMIEAAKKNTGVVFCHATGTQAHTANLDNFYDAFASIYEGRYLAGVAAGMKLNELIEAGKFTADNAKVGYVGAFPYAEVVSGYTSFFLGVRSVCPTATMEVRYTGSWFDPDKEEAAANALISAGCKLISQHADSLGAPKACEDAGVPNVSYNGSTLAAGPNTYIISSKIDWTPYYVKMIDAVIKGEKVEEKDYVGTLATGSVKVEAASANAATGTQEAIDAAANQLKAGTLKVFDCNNFTVKGAKLTTYLADVDDYGDYKPETEVIKDGYFHESEYRSAPYFDIRIDGITEIND